MRQPINEPKSKEFYELRRLEKEIQEEETSLKRKHEIMYELLEIIKEEHIKSPIFSYIGTRAFRMFPVVRDYMTVDIMTKLLIANNNAYTPTMLRELYFDASKDFYFMFWEVCYENDFPIGREYLLDRFHSNKKAYPKFAKWYDKKYNLGVKLQDMPMNMGLDLLGWEHD
jgi:hypothetical protein